MRVADQVHWFVVGQQHVDAGAQVGFEFGRFILSEKQDDHPFAIAAQLQPHPLDAFEFEVKLTVQIEQIGVQDVADLNREVGICRPR